MDRVSRFINNRKQDKIRVVNAQPSLQSMREGEEVLFFNRKGVLSRYRKERGILWRSDMYKNNDLNVEETLNASNLKYSSTFIDYRYFIHNFSDDINTDTILYGLTYKPIPNISFKIDMGTEETGSTENNILNIGLGYMF